jgi:hypothetical protein
MGAMSELHADRSASASLMADQPEPIFTVRDGRVFHRGVYRDPHEAVRLLAVYRDSAEAGDWWASDARDRADELEAAMLAAGYLQQPEQRSAA